jgi:hypothetical protein
MRVSHERWLAAQDAEFREYRDHSVESAEDRFMKTFKILGVNPKEDFKDKVIVEVAAGSVPALTFVEAKRKIAIEPLMEKWVEQRKAAEAAGIEVVCEAYEYLDIELDIDETWFFNCIEHVIDPVEQLQTAMKTSKVVRLFEATNGLPPSTAHPHTITKDLITEVMGDFGKIYKGGSRYKKNFHQSDCYYGTWVRDDV